MLGISFSEILVVVILAIVLLDPKKLKEYIKLIKYLYVRLNNFKKEITRHLGELKETIEEKEREENSETINIIGEDGKVYKAYNLEKLGKIKGIRKTEEDLDLETDRINNNRNINSNIDNNIANKNVDVEK